MTYDQEKAWEAQEEFCENYQLPMFAEKWCFRCGRNVFGESSAFEFIPMAKGNAPMNDPTRHGYSVEEAGGKLITCCPFCGYSFLE